CTLPTVRAALRGGPVRAPGGVPVPGALMPPGSGGLVVVRLPVPATEGAGGPGRAGLRPAGSPLRVVVGDGREVLRPAGSPGGAAGGPGRRAGAGPAARPRPRGRAGDGTWKGTPGRPTPGPKPSGTAPAGPLHRRPRITAATARFPRCPPGGPERG